MDRIREDFELIYQKVIGNMKKDTSIPWVEDAFVKGTDFAQAYDIFWEVRENLCRRFSIDWEDEDLEGFMDAVITLERDLAQRMFYYGMVYARRNYKL